MNDAYLIRHDLDRKNSRPYVHLELSTRELKALGDLVSQWSLLESMVQEYSELMASNVQGPVPSEIYSDSFIKRVRAMAALSRAALANHKDLPDVLAVIAKISALQGQAHKLRHGLIRWTRENRNKIAIHSRKNAHEAPWIMDGKGIEAWARKIAELNAEFLSLHGLEIVASAPRREYGKPVQLGPDLKRILLGESGSGEGHRASPQARKPRQRSSPGSRDPK
jgi:hypothetical protein